MNSLTVKLLAAAGMIALVGLASWMLGELARANNEHGEAQRIAAEIGAGREQCLAAFLGAIGLIGVDLAAGLELTRESIETSRSIGFTWGEGFASTVDGILHAVAGDLETAPRPLEPPRGNAPGPLHRKRGAGGREGMPVHPRRE